MSLSPLLPVRHKQSDFFIADIFDNLPFKDDMASMEHPLFTLSQKADMRILRYENDDAAVEMQPSAYGLPNIMDKDLLLYCASVIMAKINNGETPAQTIRLSLRDVLIATNRNTCKKSYDAIKTALNRLTGCMLKTTIKTGGTQQEEGFHLIDKYRYLESERIKGRLIGVEITLSDWFYNSLIAKEVLTIDARYFQLRKALDRRIYEIARKHCGHKATPWPVSLEKLHKKCGTSARLSHFRDTTKRLSASNHLPEYLVKYDSDRDIVSFRYRGKTRASKEEQSELFSETPPSIPTQIPPDLLEDVRHAVGQEALDYYDLWQQWRNWDGSKCADNMRGAFIGFCKTKAAKAMRA